MSNFTEEQAVDSLLNEFKQVDAGSFEKPERRLTSAQALRDIHEHNKKEDEPSERNRAKIQGMIDYQPPLNQDVLNKRGRGNQFNINFGEGAAIKNEAMNHYLDMFTSPQYLLDLKLSRDVYDKGFTPTEVGMWEQVLSEEYTRLIRDWEGSTAVFLMLADQFITHGVGVGYFPDKSTWQFESTGLGEFKFPRRTKIHTNTIDICTCETEITTADLAQKIQNEKAAAKLGWDVDLVKRVIAFGSNGDNYDHNSEEDAQEQIKANDYDHANPSAKVTLIYSWVKEYTGKVSFYITSLNAPCKKNADGTYENPEYAKGFLFKSEDLYDEMEQAIHLFPFYTGNRGNLYTVRGLGYMVYGLVQASNLMQCHALDSARAAMSIKLISNNETRMDEIPIAHVGPYTLIPPSLQIAEKQVEPDLSRVSIPAMEILQGQINKMSASSSMSNVFNNGQDRRSKFEISAAIEYFTSINSAAMRLFAKPWRAMLVESAKRAFAKGQNGLSREGKLANVMRQRCLDRGVPEEIFGMIDWISTNTKNPLGLGNKAARTATYAEGAALLPYMDEVGKKQFAIDRAINAFGPEIAPRYIPFDNQERMPIDYQIAELENVHLLEQQYIEPGLSENSFVHLQSHITKLVEVNDSVASGEADLREVTPGMAVLYEHAIATWESATVEEVLEPRLQQMKQTLQQLGETVQNGLRQLEADARKAEKEQQIMASQGDGNDGELESNAIKHQQEMAFKQQDHEQKMQHNEAEFLQKQAMRDAEKASEIAE